MRQLGGVRQRALVGKLGQNKKGGARNPRRLLAFLSDHLGPFAEMQDTPSQIAAIAGIHPVVHANQHFVQILG